MYDVVNWMLGGVAAAVIFGIGWDIGRRVRHPPPGRALIATDGQSGPRCGACASCAWWKHLEDGYGVCNRFGRMDGAPIHGDTTTTPFVRAQLNIDEWFDGPVRPRKGGEHLWLGTMASFGCREWTNGDERRPVLRLVEKRPSPAARPSAKNASPSLALLDGGVAGGGSLKSSPLIR